MQVRGGVRFPALNSLPPPPTSTVFRRDYLCLPLRAERSHHIAVICLHWQHAGCWDSWDDKTKKASETTAGNLFRQNAALDSTWNCRREKFLVRRRQVAVQAPSGVSPRIIIPIYSFNQLFGYSFIYLFICLYIRLFLSLFTYLYLRNRRRLQQSHVWNVERGNSLGFVCASPCLLNSYRLSLCESNVVIVCSFLWTLTRHEKQRKEKECKREREV